MKRTISLILAVMMLLSTFAGMTFTAEAKSFTGWKQEEDSWGDLEWHYYKNGTRQTGWLELKGKWYYLDPEWDGEMICNCVHTVGKNNFFFDKNGVMKTGWCKNSYGSWYYAKASGALATGWLKLSGKWYYFDKESNYMYVGAYKVGSKIELFNASGAWVEKPKAGWNSTKITYHYEDSDHTYTEWCYYKSGKFVTGWLRAGGKWYFFDKIDGYMYTGCFYDGKAYYYANKDGSLREKAGWVQDEYGDWYYTYKSGQCATGMITVGGKMYYLDEEEAYLWTNDDDIYWNGRYYWSDENGVCYEYVY